MTDKTLIKVPLPVKKPTPKVVSPVKPVKKAAPKVVKPVKPVKKPVPKGK